MQQSSNIQVKVSIITVVYNGKELIEKTIQSVLAQTYPHIEYIIIDGASKDGTQALIEKYKNHIQYYISEPDKGIYDAMNKGLKAATGQYVWFMNAGDLIFEQDTLEKAMLSAGADADIIYGDSMWVNEKYEQIGLRSKVSPHQLPENLHWRSFQKGMVVSHQSILIKRTIAAYYDLSHPFCADIDWIIKALKKSQKVKYLPFTLSIYLKGGTSDRKLGASLTDRFKVLSKHYGFLMTLWNHILILLRAFWFRLLT